MADRARPVGERPDGCCCGNGEAEDDRSAVLRCPEHRPEAFAGQLEAVAASPTETGPDLTREDYECFIGLIGDPSGYRPADIQYMAELKAKLRRFLGEDG